MNANLEHTRAEFNNELYLCSKKVQCEKDYRTYSVFVDQSRRDESGRNTFIKDFKKALKDQEEMISKKYAILDSKKLEERLLELPSKSELCVIKDRSGELFSMYEAKFKEFKKEAE